MSGEAYMVSEVENCEENVEACLHHVLIRVPNYNGVMALLFYH